jgi:hypothetical protein
MNFVEIKDSTSLKKKRYIYNFLISNLNESVFCYFGFFFFLDFLENKLGKNFYIKHDNKIVSYVSYIDSFEEKKLKNLIIKFILRNPFFFLLNVLRNINFFFKFHNSPKKYLQLMHLIINTNNINETSLKKNIHRKINNLNYKICKFYNYRGLYAMYSRNNKRASSYYKKNNYILYDKNFFFCFVKKKII